MSTDGDGLTFLFLSRMSRSLIWSFPHDLTYLSQCRTCIFSIFLLLHISRLHMVQVAWDTFEVINKYRLSARVLPADLVPRDFQKSRTVIMSWPLNFKYYHTYTLSPFFSPQPTHTHAKAAIIHILIHCKHGKWLIVSRVVLSAVNEGNIQRCNLVFLRTVHGQWWLTK